MKQPRRDTGTHTPDENWLRLKAGRQPPWEKGRDANEHHQPFPTIQGNQLILMPSVPSPFSFSAGRALAGALVTFSFPGTPAVPEKIPQNPESHFQVDLGSDYCRSKGDLDHPDPSRYRPRTSPPPSPPPLQTLGDPNHKFSGSLTTFVVQSDFLSTGSAGLLWLLGLDIAHIALHITTCSFESCAVRISSASYLGSRKPTLIRPANTRAERRDCIEKAVSPVEPQIKFRMRGSMVLTIIASR